MAKVAAIAAVSTGVHAAERCDGPLCLLVEPNAGAITIAAVNRGAYAPVTVTVAVTVTAPDAEVAGPGRGVLPPGGRADLARISWPGGGAGEWRYDYKWLHGAPSARPDPDALYVLPFDLPGSQVAQGCDGWVSHRGAAGQAVDFALPEGTPVLAARAGRVVGLRMDRSAGGLERAQVGQDNRVLVLHDDGTVALYGHLAQDSARVRVGQPVAAGDALALSGDTGYSAAPHLHVEVYSPLPDGGRRTWPMAWDTAAGTVTCPRRGTTLRR
ncbi:M23 family metallopeptidase [Palleronia pelagia]|uniref:Peptidase family M23 n=1 Tax=Palleronia pelagia TaxID=387096 RepID=A0A1H8K211_9RHOB|nr:M23 family metallopeptidase [Palleronia pelagia]SEN86811.1 Peptidase family M23 [Palleronia pelagia]